MEIKWKPLIYKELDLSDSYLISNDGQLYSKKTNKILKQKLNEKTGYYGVCVSLGSRSKKKLIRMHLAVAYNFVEGYAPELVVNHKDGDKTNNNFYNLEWVTKSENTRHALRHGLMGYAKRIKCLNTGEIFESVSAACRWCGLYEHSRSIEEYFTMPYRKSAGRHPQTGEQLQWELL